jgi:hypothetical protein
MNYPYINCFHKNFFKLQSHLGGVQREILTNKMYCASAGIQRATKIGKLSCTLDSQFSNSAIWYFLKQWICNVLRIPGSADPYHWITDQDPAIFFSDLTMPTKISFCFAFLLTALLTIVTYTSIFKDYKLRSHKTVGNT